MLRRHLLGWLAAVVGLGTLAALPAAADERFIIVASTTSTQDSGLFDYLLPLFTQKTGIEVRVLYKGTGEAIKVAQNGDADVLLVIGALGGLLNGTLIARGGLPSLVVTLGTLALFRGLALIVLGPRGVSDFPPGFTAIGFGKVPGTEIPWPFVIFLTLAVILGVVLHRSWAGRQVYAIGKNTGAARFSGVRVARIKIALFMLTGLIAALAGVILTSRLSSARADAGQGMTLTVVTVVLLGGVNIFGGSGTIPGVVLAVLVVAVMQNALRLAGVSVDVQSIALGLLLIVSVVIPTFAHQAKSAADRVFGGRPPPPDSIPSGERASA
jgi:rhamnose transport system permease protein